MSLRDQRRDRAPTRWRARGESLALPIAIVALTLVALLTVFAWLWWKGRQVAVATDPATLCLVGRKPPEVAVILIDVSDRFTDPQTLEIRNHLAREQGRLPQFGLVEVYTVDRLGRRVTTPVFHLCNPGTGVDANPAYQNPELAKRRWLKFADSLTAEIGRQVALPHAGTSPIFEAIQATALRTFGRPEYDSVPKRLVIISDLLQHTPGGMSMYSGIPSFDAFVSTPYFSQVRADLHDVSVYIYYLIRSDVATQSRFHLKFWEAYFRYQGAIVESLQKVFGDK